MEKEYPNTLNDEKCYCDSCKKEIEDSEKSFEVGYNIVCMDCLDKFNEQYELLVLK